MESTPPVERARGEHHLEAGVTQCAAILAHLEAGNTITPLEAYALCGTLALHSRISELREQFHDIHR